MSIQCSSCLTSNSDSQQYCISCGDILETNPTSVNYHLSTETLLKQGKYQIEKVLGIGGFGITYKAIYLPNSALVAIKELWPEKAARQGKNMIWPYSITPKERQNQINSFKLEASYLQKCTHPNIVKVYEWFDENNTVYIVMEFVAGKSLSDILKQEGKLSESRVKHYFLQIAEALKAVHAQNFLHRDIKPDNILINSQDKAILIDFGATKEFIAGQTREMSVTLTQGYAPLEQYSYNGKRWAATDFYALCASMYELLTGNLPPEAVLRVHSETLISPRQLRLDLSDLMEKVILTGLRMRVEERFQTADELINALNGKFISPNLKRAKELVKQGKLIEAVQAYEKCLTNEPNNGEAAVELALVQIYIDDSQAEIAAKKAIHISPNDGRGYGILGLVNCRKSNWSEAVKQLEISANLAPQQTWILANFAWALGKSKNWQQAEIMAKKALEIDSNCPFILGIKAWIAIHQQQWKPAISAATQAIFKSKQTPSQNSQQLQRWVYPCLIFALEKALVAKQATDLDRRIEEFITQIPDSAWGWGFKGWKQAQQDLWAEALTSFKQASCQTPIPSWVLVNRGIIQERLYNLQEAIETYEIYNQQFLPNYFVLFRLGTSLAQIGQWLPAFSYLEKSIQLKPDYAEAYHNIGWVLLNIINLDGEVGNVHKLLSAYRRAVELYKQQNKLNKLQAIKQAFQSSEIEL